MTCDLFYCRWAAVLLGLAWGTIDQNQAFGQADVEPFIRQMDGLQLLLKADAGVTREDHTAKGGTANGVKGWADYSGRGNHLFTDRPSAMSVLQEQLRDWIVQYGDFALEAFDQRDSPAALDQFMKDYSERSGKEVEALKPY